MAALRIRCNVRRPANARVVFLATVERRRNMDEKTEALLRKRLEENERRLAQADEKTRAIQDSVADLRKESRRIKARLRYERRKSETEDLRAQRDELEAEVERLRAENASMHKLDLATSRYMRETEGKLDATDGTTAPVASNSSGDAREGTTRFVAPRLFRE